MRIFVLSNKTGQGATELKLKKGQSIRQALDLKSPERVTDLASELSLTTSNFVGRFGFMIYRNPIIRSILQ